ncbi:MAG TPA: helix-turn-helix domain-containing protein [Steroidobacteraceae bacterium]|nr:helix-turn-helix domain-containing protein [Steroidobacteraceae bacterium]
MSTTEAGGETRCGIGTRLRRGREARGLTVLQAAEKLHVDARILESLEAEDFAALGAPVYARGHLRRYADLLGENFTQLQSLYPAAAQPAGPDLTRIPRGEPDTRSPRLVLLALLVLLGFALAGLLWWLLALAPPKQQPVSAGQAGSASAEQLMTAIDAQAPERDAPAAIGAEAQLALKFYGLSWAEVTDASGRRLLEGLNAPDSARTLSGKPPLRVVIGNAPGVTVQLNGTRVALDGLVHRDGTARFIVDGGGRAAALPPRVAHGD